MLSSVYWVRLLGMSAFACGAAMPALAAPSTMGDDSSIVSGAPSALASPGGRGFAISANLRTLYDGNILRRGDGIIGIPGDSIQDYRISPSVSGEYGLPVGRQQIFLTGTVGRDYFVRNTRLDRNRYAAGAAVALAAGSSCKANLDVDIASRQVLFSELGVLVPNAQETLTYGAAANCGSAIGLGFGGGVRQTRIRNDSITRSDFDLNGTAYNVQLSYRLGNIGAFTASGSLNQVTYVNRQVLDVDGGSIDDGVDIVSARFGYSREIGSRLSLTAGLSYFESKPQPGTILQIFAVPQPPLPPLLVAQPVDRDPFSGLGYDLSVAYRPSSRLAVVLAASRNASASVNVGAVSQVQTNLVADIDYKLGSGINLGTGLSYNRRQYQNPTNGLSDLGRARVEDKITRVYANIGYTTSRLLSLAFEVAYQDRNSLPVEFSFDSFTASLNLTFKFGRKS